ncbi:MAG: agmatinase family protein [Cyclobacteriaceae bacterium]|nr:agmatinase family protein [Cyclobacteriaceae bacterium]
MKSYSKERLLKKFDPNGIGQAGRLFGLPFDQKTSEIVVIPVPWDVTASFHDGASLGPKAILNVSSQIDLFLQRIPDAWKLGITMLPIDDEWITKNNQARKYAVEYIKNLEGGISILSGKDSGLILQNINMLSNKINDWVFTKSKDILKAGKIPVVLGGDHSSPFGLMKAISDSFDEFGVLQIDAHADLRPHYQGFEFSHASIMHNLLKFKNVSKLVQVGIRDFCEQERDVMEKDQRIITYYDESLARDRFEGVSWANQVKQIIESLPDVLYISLDIDGLEQLNCPSTGTPVPGGLSYNQLIYLFEKLMGSGKKILSFDICEVSGAKDEWDAIVGSRLLYNLANITGVTQNLLQCN